MVSQRYLDFKRFLGKLWRSVLRYWLMIYLLGCLIAYVFEIIRSSYSIFLLVWTLASLGLVFFVFMIFVKPERDLDGDY